MRPSIPEAVWTWILFLLNLQKKIGLAETLVTAPWDPEQKASEQTSGHTGCAGRGLGCPGLLGLQ